MISTYDKYKNARDEAWKQLIKHKLTNFPLNIEELADKLNVKIKAFSQIPNTVNTLNVQSLLAFPIIIAANSYIAVNDAILYPQKRFAIAHELGHILLGHVIEGNPKALFDTFEENEANIFASRLLMPAIVCRTKSLTTTERIARHFGVSNESAKIRAERIAILLQRNKWEYSALEQKYLEIYKKAESKTPL